MLTLLSQCLSAARTDQRRLVSVQNTARSWFIMSVPGIIPKSWLFQKVGPAWGLRVFSNLEQLLESQVFCKLWLQGYTLADEEEDPLIYQHRMLRSGQGDALASGPVETGPMKKLHVSTINLQKASPLCPGGTWKGEPCSCHLFKTFSSCHLLSKITKSRHFSENLDTMNLGYFVFLQVSELHSLLI